METFKSSVPALEAATYFGKTKNTGKKEGTHNVEKEYSWQIKAMVECPRAGVEGTDKEGVTGKGGDHCPLPGIVGEGKKREWIRKDRYFPWAQRGHHPTGRSANTGSSHFPRSWRERKRNIGSQERLREETKNSRRRPEGRKGKVLGGKACDPSPGGQMEKGSGGILKSIRGGGLWGREGILSQIQEGPLWNRPAGLATGVKELREGIYGKGLRRKSAYSKTRAPLGVVGGRSKKVKTLPARRDALDAVVCNTGSTFIYGNEGKNSHERKKNLGFREGGGKTKAGGKETQCVQRSITIAEKLMSDRRISGITGSRSSKTK